METKTKTMTLDDYVDADPLALLQTACRMASFWGGGTESVLANEAIKICIIP